jgi:DNA-binding TFAR19-related protein (PDSD5 family)
MSQEEDPELAIIRARKMKQLKEKAALIEKIKESKSDVKKVDDKELLLKYLYDRGDEVLDLAESQYPVQAKLVVNRIVELIKSGDLDSLISGG